MSSALTVEIFGIVALIVLVIVGGADAAGSSGAGGFGRTVFCHHLCHT